MSEVDQTTSCDEVVTNTETNVEKHSIPEQERDVKRRKTNQSKVEELQSRLNAVLSCIICLDLPKDAVYQCNNGHLLCAGCFTYLHAYTSLKDEKATCPNCQVEIYKSSTKRNLAVEKAVGELLSPCQYCHEGYPRNCISVHQEKECEQRATSCKYNVIGCLWKGPMCQLGAHESVCVYPQSSGADVMKFLEVIDQKNFNERKLYDNIFELLGYEKVMITDIQLKPYQSDEIANHCLFYQTLHFSAFDEHWMVKAKIDEKRDDADNSAELNMYYKLILKTKAPNALNMHFILLQGPFEDIKVQPRVYNFVFTEEDRESPYVSLPLQDESGYTRLINAKLIYLRLITFLAAK